MYIEVISSFTRRDMYYVHCAPGNYIYNRSKDARRNDAVKRHGRKGETVFKDFNLFLTCRFYDSTGRVHRNECLTSRVVL